MSVLGRRSDAPDPVPRGLYLKKPSRLGLAVPTVDDQFRRIVLQVALCINPHEIFGVLPHNLQAGALGVLRQIVPKRLVVR
ncbi:hypothetical protein D3C85_1352620 [compost metagenome]